MHKTTRILISSLILVSVLFSAIAFSKPVPVVQAEQPETDIQKDAYGNVVFDGDVAYNYIQEPSGEFFRVALDEERNVIEKEKLSHDPFENAPDSGDGQMDTLPALAPLASDSYLSSEWSFHTFGSGLGANGLNIADIDDDGSFEVVAGDTSSKTFAKNDRWFVLRATTPTDYVQVYVSEIYTQTVKQVLTADVDGNAINEIYVALADKRLLIYSGADFGLIGSFSSALIPNSMLITDANGDGASEIILSDGTGIAAYDAMTFQLIWQTSGYGGNLAAGDVDGDGNSEIVSSKGYVLNGATREVVWYYPATSGFGARVAVGDVDGDGIAEIVGAAGSYKITIFEATLKSPMWEITTQIDIAELMLADMNNDQRTDILYGDGQWGSVYAIDGQTHQVFWQIRNPEHGVTRIAVGDTDQDGQLEVLWGAGYSSTGPDYLYIVDVLSKTIEWQNIDMDGPLSAVDAGDVDDDGQVEIVMASNSSNSGYDDGIVSIFDADTHALEWQSIDLPGIRTLFGIGSLRIGDVDQDGHTEFVLATANSYDGLIQIYDGATHTLERQSTKFTGAIMTALEVGDVDGDSKTEIVAGQLHENYSATGISIIVFDGETAAVEWQSTNLGINSVYDIQLADVDQDHQMEIIVSVKGGAVYVFNGVTHVLETLIPTTAYSLAVADLNQNGMQSILIGLSNGTVDVYNGASYGLEKTIVFTTKPIACLNFVDVNNDLVPEWLVCSSGQLMVYTNDANTLLWQSRYLGDDLGWFNQIPTGQFDLDSNPEIVVGSTDALYQFEQNNPLRASQMKVSKSRARSGDRLTYEIEINNHGVQDFSDATLTNLLPEELSYVSETLTASSGNAIYDHGVISWAGTLSAGSRVTVTYQVSTGYGNQSHTAILNSAQITAGGYTKTVSAQVDLTNSIYLPICLKSEPMECGNFLDTFRNPNSGWPVVNDDFMQTEYLDEEYRFLAKDPNYVYLIKAPTCKLWNYSVEVDARWESTPGNGYGLIFGLSDDFSRYYLFLIDTDHHGYELIYYDQDGVSYLTRVINDFSIDTASWKHLKVSRYDDRITLEINGIEKSTLFDYHTNEPTYVGLVNLPYSDQPNVEARFDNFHVMTISGLSTSGLPSPDSTVPAGMTSSLSWALQKNPFIGMDAALIQGR